MDLIKGRFIGNKKGFGFVVPEESTSEKDNTQDIMIPPSCVNGALHGDTVIARIISRPKGRRIEGEIMKIVERGTKSLVGLYKSKHNGGVVYPDDDRFSVNVFIPFKQSLGAKSGQKVTVEITGYPKKYNAPDGKVTEILGGMWEPGIELKCIARAHGFTEKFSPAAAAEAKKVCFIRKADYEGREDFRGKLTITIDGEDAKDLDDAVSLERTGEEYVLGVHIADVSHYVRENSELDKEAFKRATSVYFPGAVIPMLPKELSNGICSLNEGEDRLTLSVIMNVDKNGRVTDSRVCRSVINSRHRMTYTDVTSILEGKYSDSERYADIKDMLSDMAELSKKLNALRRSRGSIELEIPETKFELDACGNVTDIGPYPRTVSHKIIEEFMLLANETIARTFCYADIPFIYRVHGKPDGEKAERFFAFAKGLGLKVNRQNFDSKTYVDLLKQTENTDVEPMLNRIMLRSMQKAEYKPENLGHFGLAAEFYCHFTSPIRRYPDLAIHRIIKSYLKGELNEKLESFTEFTQNASAQSSKMERAADLAEREADDMKKAEYMSGEIGNTYEGIISGVTAFGIFVELKNTAEGLIKIDDLPGGYYDFIPEKYILRNGDNSYSLGDRVKITVAGTDIKNGKINFVLAGDEQNTTEKEIKKHKTSKSKRKKY